jgi:hypothetical protein
LRGAALHGPNPKPFRDGLIAATALVHSLVVVTRNLADFEATGVRMPPTVLLLCLWAWRGLLAALWAGAEECCRVASGEGIVRVLSAALFNDDFCRPSQRQTLCRKKGEVGVGHTEDFADGGGGFGWQAEFKSRISGFPTGLYIHFWPVLIHHCATKPNRP